MSWSVRGVDNDARESALAAAREAGVPVGEWLNGLILQDSPSLSASGGHATARQAGAGRQGGAGQADIRSALETMQERVERLSSTAAAVTPRRQPQSLSHSDVDQVAEIARALDDLLDEAQQARVTPQSERRTHRASSTSPTPSRRETAAPHRTGNDPARMQRVERVLATLDTLDRRVRTLSNQDDGTEGSTIDRASKDADRHDAAMTGFDTRTHSLQAAIDEISARKDDLRTVRTAPAPRRAARSAQPIAERRPTRTADAGGRNDGSIDRHFGDLAQRIDTLRAPQDSEFNELRSEMADLRQAIVSRERNGASQHDLNDMARLADLVERLHNEPADSAVVDGLRTDIAELREAVIDNNIDGTLKTLEHGYAHIVQRLDELRRMVGDPRILDGLDNRLVEIEHALASLPQLTEFSAMEDRLQALSHRIDDAATRNGGADIAHLENEIQALRRMIGELDVRDIVRSVDDRLRGVGDRIGELEDAVTHAGSFGERIAAVEERLPDSDAFDRLNHRLERIGTMLSEDRNASNNDTVDARLSEIVGRLDSIERRPQESGQYDIILALLEKRIGAMTAKLEDLDAKPLGSGALDAAIQRIDDALDRTSDTQRLEDLQAQIADLSARFDTGSQSSGTDIDVASLRQDLADLRHDLTQPERLAEILEPQIHELARSLTSGDRMTPDDAALARIEQQIAVIAGQLDATEDRLSGLQDIEIALGKIGGALSDDRAPTAAPSRAATPKQDDDVAALRGDLSRLMQAAGAGALEADAGVAEIQEAMNSIIARLSSLENESVEMRGHAEYAAGGQVAMGGRAVAVGGGGGRMPPASFHPSALEKALASDDTDSSSDRPLEPGSGKPDIAALLREHSDRGKPRSSKESAHDRKADFIAAARRAAQAAAAEVAAEDIGSDSHDAEPGESRGGWLRGRLKSVRRNTASKADAGKLAGDPHDAAPRSEPQFTGESIDEALHAEDLANELAENQTEHQAGEKPIGRIRRALRSRRPIVLAAAAVILAIGAIKMASTENLERISSFISSPDAPATASQSMDGAGSQTATPPAADTTAAPLDTRTIAPPKRSDAGSNAAMPDQSVAFEPPATQLGQFGDTTPVLAPNGFTQAPMSSTPSTQAPETTVASIAPRAVLQTPADVLPPIDAMPMISSAPQAPSIDATPGQQQDLGLTAPMPETAVGPISLRLAAANGNPRAQFEVAARYTEGRGVLADPTKAAEWYKRAADGGLAPAQYRLGSLYEKGRGVARDADTARKWYKRAADQGNAKAMHNLAVIFAAGGVGSPDFVTATHWFKTASKLGVRDSQFNLGILYARGFGVDQDLIESYRWFSLAARQGDHDAAAKRDEVAASLSPQDLSAAELLVNTWQSEPLQEMANVVTLDPVWTDVPVKRVSQVSEELVLQTQLLLGELGFDTGPADGMVGPKTRDAVRAFQQNAGLPVTGTIDRQLIQVLGGRSI